MKTKNEFKSSEQNQIRQIILEKTGVDFNKNFYLLNQAFVRSSYANKNGCESNEKLEFFGDLILGFYVGKAIADKYGFMRTNTNVNFNGNIEYAFRGTEKDFTELKQSIVCNENLASIIDDWDVVKYLVVSKQDITSKIDLQVKPKADLFEAILGAIAIHCKWDSDTLEKTVNKMLSLDTLLVNQTSSKDRPENFSLDTAINTLKEMAEHGICSIPSYEFSGPDNLGYDENGNPKWECTCRVTLDSDGIIRSVFANSKKAAQRCAAYLIVCQYYELQNEYGQTKSLLCWEFKNNVLTTIPNDTIE